MKSKLLLCVVSISIITLGGCAGTPASKSPSTNTSASTNTKDTKALSAKDIIARYEKAIYGKEGVAKHSSMTVKGTLSIEQFAVEGPFVRYARAPDSNVSNIEVMGMSLSNGCHKGVCWGQQPGAGTTILSGDAAAMQLQQADYNQWEHMDRYYTSMEIVPPADGKESANYKIKAVKKNGDTDYYDFSKESGLLVAAVFEGETGQGRMKIAIQFKNYKDFDGFAIPTELTQSTPQATIKLTFTEVSFAPLTDDKFAKPN
jgi:hypothetical protein